MTVTDWLRLTLMASVASACAPAIAEIWQDTDTDTDSEQALPCDALGMPRLTSEADYNGVGDYLVCGPLPAQGTCPSQDQATRFVYESLGDVSDPDFCGWWVEPDVCGPVPVNRGECCYVAKVEVICEGRPLTVQNRARTAASIPGADWLAELAAVPPVPEPTRSLARAAWRRAALAEHASIASFSRFVMELLALGAPADLIQAATEAQADEVRHARIAFAVLSAFSGRPERPGPLIADVQPRTEPGEILAATLIEGCLNESLAAARAAEAARLCTCAVLAAVLAEIAEDEARHAALAWRSARWILSRHPQLQAVARQTLVHALEADPRAMDPDPAPADAYHLVGLLPPSQARALDRRVLAAVVRPVAESIVGSLDDRCPEA